MPRHLYRKYYAIKNLLPILSLRRPNAHFSAVNAIHNIILQW